MNRRALGGEKRLENSPVQFGSNARTGILDGDPHRLIAALGGDAQLARFLAVALHRIQRVVEQLLEHAAQAASPRCDGGQQRRGFPIDHRAPGQQPLLAQFQCLAQQLVDVDRRYGLRRHLGNQGAQPFQRGLAGGGGLMQSVPQRRIRLIAAPLEQVAGGGD